MPPSQGSAIFNFHYPQFHTLGGNAYLTLDNTDEPYLGGIRFTAMPPMKRFRSVVVVVIVKVTVIVLVSVSVVVVAVVVIVVVMVSVMHQRYWWCQ